MAFSNVEIQTAPGSPAVLELFFSSGARELSASRPAYHYLDNFFMDYFLIHKKQHCQEESLLRLNEPKSNCALSFGHAEMHARLTRAGLNGDLDTAARSLEARSVMIEWGVEQDKRNLLQLSQTFSCQETQNSCALRQRPRFEKTLFIVMQSE